MSAPPTACCQLLLEGAAAHLLHIGLATCLKPLMYSNGESLVDAVLTIHVHNNVYVQVGVLVGKPAVGSRDILLAAIRTPSQVRVYTFAPCADKVEVTQATPAARAECCKSG